MTFDEKGKVVKSVQPIKTPVRTRSYFQVCGTKPKQNGVKIEVGQMMG
jgi:hypothetical protein